ncbi:MAG: hypothetical protein ACO3SK_00075 [Ilumatobacteraceae bacterium]
MNILEPFTPELICDVNSAAAAFRLQARFFEGLQLRQLLLHCSEDIWSMPSADLWRQSLRSVIHLVESHCDSLRHAATQLEYQTFTGASNGSGGW